MANCVALQYRQDFTGTDTVIVSHSLGRQGLGVQVIVDGECRSDLIQSITPDPADPNNRFTLVLASSQSGFVQVFYADLMPVWSISEEVKAAIDAAGISVADLPATENYVDGKSEVTVFGFGRSSTGVQGVALEYAGVRTNLSGPLLDKDRTLYQVTIAARNPCNSDILVVKNKTLPAILTIPMSNQRKKVQACSIDLAQGDELGVAVASAPADYPVVSLFCKTGVL